MAGLALSGTPLADEQATAPASTAETQAIDPAAM